MSNETVTKSKSNYKRTMNFLHYNLGFSIHDSNSIMRRYGDMKGIDYPKDSNVYGYITLRKQAFDKIGDIIQQNWQEFMRYYGSIKKNYRRIKTPQKEQATIQTV